MSFSSFNDFPAINADVPALASSVAAMVVLWPFLLFLFIWNNQRLRESYPTYDQIPATILAHMPSKKELAQLDNTLDVIVSFVCVCVCVCI